MPQFTVSVNTAGDIKVESGVVIDMTGSLPVLHRFKNSSSFALAPDITSASRWNPKFCGGSGKNIFIEPDPTNAALPSGWYSVSNELTWLPENQGAYSWSMDPSTLKVSLKDSLGVSLIESANGAFAPYGRIACSSIATSGNSGNHSFTVDLGTGTGTVQLDYDPNGGSATFKVEYDGSTTSTGAVTTSGSTTFFKSSAYPTTAVVKVISSYFASDWSCSLGCPGGGSAPYQTTNIGSGPQLFAATTTTAGAALFGAAYTLNCYYEGNKAVSANDGATSSIDPSIRTRINFQSESSIIGKSSDYLCTWDEYKFMEWTPSTSESLLSFLIADDGLGNGDAVIYDGTDIVATRTGGFLLDPTGGYESTEYGAETYNDNVSFMTNVSMHRNSPLADMIVYITINFSGTTITSIEGPFTAYAMPSFSTGKKHIPLAMVHPDLTVDQLSEGSIVWT